MSPQSADRPLETSCTNKDLRMGQDIFVIVTSRVDFLYSGH